MDAIGKGFCGIGAFVALCMATAPTVAMAQDPAPAETRVETDLRPGDILEISVWPDETLGGSFTVEESGFVYLPYLGRVRASGVSLEQLRRQLRQGYGEVMRNPVVTITPVYGVGILGQVRSPGIYRVTPANTLFEVIAMAGGFTGAADQEELRIVRAGSTFQVDALRALEEGSRELLQLRLQSGDQVIVPTRSGGISFRDVVTFIQTGATIAFLVDRAFGN